MLHSVLCYLAQPLRGKKQKILKFSPMRRNVTGKSLLYAGFGKPSNYVVALN